MEEKEEMKKVVLIVLALMLTFGVFACTTTTPSNPSTDNAGEKKTVKIAYHCRGRTEVRAFDRSKKGVRPRQRSD